MNKFLTKIYLYRFFDDLVLIYPLYVVMFVDYKMQPWQVSVLLAVWSVTTFFLEVPSGVWADKYSRKNILFLAQIIRAIGYLCWLFFPNFIGFTIGFVLWGIKSAMTSGTFQALIYDELKQSQKEKEFTKVLGRTKTLSFVAVLTASLLSSLAIIFGGYPTVLILSSAAVLLSGLIIISIPKAQKTESTHEKEYFSILKKGLTISFKNINILRLILFLSLSTAFIGALDEYWTIFANDTGLPHYGLGIFIGLISGSQAVASFFAHRFEKKSNKFFYSIFSINGLLLFLAAYFFTVQALLFLIILSFLFTVINVVFESNLHHSIGSETRATVASVSSFLVEIMVIIIYFGIGLITQVSNYRNSFLFFGIIIIIFGLFYLVFTKDSKKYKNKILKADLLHLKQINHLSTLLDPTNSDNEQEIKQALENGFVWVAKDDDKIVGYVSCQLFDENHEQLPNSIFVSGLFVLEEYRKQGIGKMLMNELLKAEFPEKYTCFSLSHDPEEKHLTRFYQSCGFEVIGTTKGGNVKMIKKK